MKHVSKQTLGLFGIPFIFIVLMGVFLVDIVQKHDEDIERERSRFLQAVLKNQVKDVGVVAHEYTLWSQAINEIIFNHDIGFMDENIGAYLLDTYDYDTTLVLDQNNRRFVRFDAKKEGVRPIPYDLTAEKQLLDVAQTARSVPPKDAHGAGYWIKINGELFLVGVGAFTYEESYEEKRETRSEVENYVFLTLTRANQQYWDNLSSQYSLPHLGWETDSVDGLKVPISDHQGKEISHLVLHGQKNLIQSIFENYGMVVIAMVIMLVGFALFALKRSIDFQNAHEEVLKLNKHMDELVKERTEELAIALDSAQEASRAKSLFLSSMSHEFRTPLNGILGFNQLLNLNKNGTLTDKEKDWINQIQAAGELLLSLVNDVLDLAHVESGKISIEPHPVMARDVFKRCYEMTHPLAEKRHITLKGQPETEKLIYADPRRLQQVILNLLNNAIKYNKDGGEVVFGCKNRGDHQVRLYIKDTGYGIADWEKDKIFDPFYRSDEHSSKTEGTGVGLALVQRLTEAMGGQISFESEYGKGSTFYLDFPAVDPQSSHK